MPSLEHFKKVIRGPSQFSADLPYSMLARRYEGANAFGCQTKLFDAFNPAVSEAWYVIQLYIATAFGLLSFCKVAIIT